MGVVDGSARGKVSSEREKGRDQARMRRDNGRERSMRKGMEVGRAGRESTLRSLGAHSVCGAPYPSPTSTRTHGEGSSVSPGAPATSPLQPKAQCISSDSQPLHQPRLGPVDSGSMGGGSAPKTPESREEQIPGSSVASPTSSGS